MVDSTTAQPPPTGPATECLQINSDIFEPEQLSDSFTQCLMPMAETHRISTPSLSSHDESIKAYITNDQVLSKINYLPRTVRRDHKHMARFDHDLIFISINLKGTCQFENGSFQTCCEGLNTSVLDYSEPMQAQLEALSDISLILPRELLFDRGFKRDRYSGIYLAPGDPRNTILAQTMLCAFEQLGHATPKQTDTIFSALTGMLCGMLDPIAHPDDRSQEAESATLSSMLHYLDQHLAEPSLGVDSLIRHYHRSRAAIYRLFAPIGGVSHYIQRQRLHRCYKALASASQQQRKIIDIALQWGFTNQSHFSRQFKEHYHTTPKEIRDAASENQLASINKPAENFNDYLHQHQQWFLNPC